MKKEGGVIMVTYIELFSSVKDDIDLYLVVLLSIILVSNIIDWSFGWINARFNNKVDFSSNIALYGIIKKMMYFLVLILFSIVALAIIPVEIAITAITMLYIGYLLSEIHSILSHLELTDDGKQGELFRTFIEKIFKGDSK